ncbi:MAG: excisionase family DNA-binding protein [Thermoleophilia bacterium]
MTKDEGLVGETSQSCDAFPSWLRQILQVEGRLTLTDYEAARLLGLSRGSVRQAIREEHIRVVRLGRRLLIPVIPLLALMGLDTVPQEGEPATSARDCGPLRLAGEDTNV